MSDDQINLNQWLELYNKIDFESVPDFQFGKVAAELGFYDWFCKTSSLLNKIKKMAPMVKRIINSRIIDPKKYYVFFKNNCPLSGPLYDSFSICDISDGEVLFHMSYEKPNITLYVFKDDTETKIEGIENIKAYLKNSKNVVR